jgi:hypothetical protein
LAATELVTPPAPSQSPPLKPAAIADCTPARVPFFTTIALSARLSRLLASMLGFPVTTSAKMGPAPWAATTASAPFFSVNAPRRSTVVPAAGSITKSASAPSTTMPAVDVLNGSPVIVVGPVAVSTRVVAFHDAAPASATTHDGRLSVHDSVAPLASALPADKSVTFDPAAVSVSVYVPDVAVMELKPPSVKRMLVLLNWLVVTD